MKLLIDEFLRRVHHWREECIYYIANNGGDVYAGHARADPLVSRAQEEAITSGGDSNDN